MDRQFLCDFKGEFCLFLSHNKLVFVGSHLGPFSQQMPDKCTGRLLLTCSLSSVSELCFLLSLWLHQVNMHQSLYETLLAPVRILTLKYLDWSGSSSALNYDTSKEKSGPWLNVIDLRCVVRLWSVKVWKTSRKNITWNYLMLPATTLWAWSHSS